MSRAVSTEVYGGYMKKKKKEKLSLNTRSLLIKNRSQTLGDLSKVVVEAKVVLEGLRDEVLRRVGAPPAKAKDTRGKKKDAITVSTDCKAPTSEKSKGENTKSK